MADFRRWIYALAVVALLAGFTVPASAQNPPFTCTTSVSVTPVVRAEGYTELTGDLVLNCNGGQPTTPGQPVPQVNFTVFLNTNATSKITAAPVQTGGLVISALFNEGLLIIDEPNSPLRTPRNPILNCGNAGAPDSGVASGPGVCNILATSDPAHTYDGTPNGYGGTGIGAGFVTTSCDSTGTLNTGRPLPETYTCGRPNVFQGRVGTPQNVGQLNAVSFLGVPVDPPGTTTNRTFRITNIRANATILGVSATFNQSQIQANIAINGPTTLTIANPQQIVAYVNRGMTVDIPSIGTVFATGGVALRNRLDFIQCVSENPDLFSSTPAPNFFTPNFLGFEGANFKGGNDATPLVRFTEGFASSWKTRNIAYTIANPAVTTGGNATFNTATNAWEYNGNRGAPTDLAQDVPGAVYNTESGFHWSGKADPIAPTSEPTTANSTGGGNPPRGFGFSTFTTTGGAALQNVQNNNGAVDTGIDKAGESSSGTRLSLSFTNIPSGASVWLPPVIYLFRQGSPYTGIPFPDPTSRSGGSTLTPQGAGNTGVMVLTSTDTAGAGGFVRANSSTTTPFALVKSSGLSVYEILYTDPFSLELADVPTVVAYASNVNQNLPTPGITTQVTGGFAPFYTSTAAGQPEPNNTFGSPTHIPRFIPGTGPKDLFLINKCACNLLFPYVVSAAGFDTGIAIANTSADPGNANGDGFIAAVPQPGTVTFWYYGVMANGGAVPGKQISKSVPAGQVLTYVASSGSTDWGLDGRAAGLIGYVITQAQFQYCHAYAFISALGAGPLTPGTSEGYLAIVLDAPRLPRTNQIGENDGH